MLGGRFYEVRSASERGQTLVLKVTPQSSEEDEALRQIGTQRSPIPFAFQDLAGIADVHGCERSSDSQGSFWTIDLRAQETDSLFSEMGFNGRSALDLAVLRARYVLLNEPPDPSDQFLGPFVIGSFAGRNAVDPSTLKLLWKQVGQKADSFLPLARLLAVFFLKSTGTVAQIARLELGPIEGDLMQVNFEGVRKKYYTNAEPDRISVKGTYSLT